MQGPSLDEHHCTALNTTAPHRSTAAPHRSTTAPHRRTTAPHRCTFLCNKLKAYRISLRAPVYRTIAPYRCTVHCTTAMHRALHRCTFSDLVHRDLKNHMHLVFAPWEKLELRDYVNRLRERNKRKEKEMQDSTKRIKRKF